MHIYRWDLDKTYLETDFDSLRGLVRSATEPARAKRALPGATPLLRALSQRTGARVFILSGSPTQLRDVLEEKLRLDGIRFESLVLKDSLRHLRRGQVRMIRSQFGYKLPALLRARAGLGGATRETLFGDDAEVDALVYSVYADVVAGRVGADRLSRIMEAGGAYPGQIADARASLARLSTTEAVERIFIRLERRSAPQRFAALGARLVPVHSWWQAALVLFGAGHIDAFATVRVLRSVWESRGRDTWAICGLTQDILRRGHVDAEVLGRLELPEALRGELLRAGERVGSLSAPAAASAAVDYVRLLQRWKRKAGA